MFCFQPENPAESKSKSNTKRKKECCTTKGQSSVQCWLALGRHAPVTGKHCENTVKNNVMQSKSKPYKLSEMSKAPKPPDLFRCLVCKRGLPLGSGTFARHVRISHGWELTAIDCEDMINEKTSEIPSSAKQLPKFELITRSPRQLVEWGRCDLCMEGSTRRWLFEKTTRGEIILCATCRERTTRKSKINALDSWARLPGSYGG